MVIPSIVLVIGRYFVLDRSQVISMTSGNLYATLSSIDLQSELWKHDPFMFTTYVKQCHLSVTNHTTQLIKFRSIAKTGNSHSDISKIIITEMLRYVSWNNIEHVAPHSSKLDQQQPVGRLAATRPAIWHSRWALHRLRRSFALSIFAFSMIFCRKSKGHTQKASGLKVAEW